MSAGPSPQKIESVLRAALTPLQPGPLQRLEVVNESHLHAGHAGAGEGSHFRVYIVADCMTESAVIIGATNRSITGLNNTLCLSPAYIAKRGDIDEIVAAIDGAITRTMATH